MATSYDDDDVPDFVSSEDALKWLDNNDTKLEQLRYVISNLCQEINEKDKIIAESKSSGAYDIVMLRRELDKSSNEISRLKNYTENINKDREREHTAYCDLQGLVINKFAHANAYSCSDTDSGWHRALEELKRENK